MDYRTGITVILLVIGAMVTLLIGNKRQGKKELPFVWLLIAIVLLLIWLFTS
ncbi:hypothetical protein [Priestia koreensis]|uniref:hypothetical protein n=1 Tax=Priestia koreensis TaxID=284581 RepID=UPI001F59D680|nr:hypothetical protein [Priestia koreensis]MCM3005267.1 hypothetical protein [Priestia koreensis]UNL86484.1 hypothetical protein IE339_08355 [Priestia koreensis]